MHSFDPEVSFDIFQVYMLMDQLYLFFFCSVTNGGKTTLTNKLIKSLPNCCVVHQDDFFKVSFSEYGLIHISCGKIMAHLGQTRAPNSPAQLVRQTSIIARTSPCHFACLLGGRGRKLCFHSFC
jgi:hypothetical protein